jgi:hypothetical protein
MTEYLIAVRAAIVIWINLAVMPAEILFDTIEAELELRDAEPKPRLSFIFSQSDNRRNSK